MVTRVGILIFDDVEELDAVGPYEVFGTARAERPDEFDICLIAASKDPVRCVNGLRILPDHDYASAPSIDILLIPGGVGTRKVAKDEAALAWVREVATKTRLVASVCTGARVTLASGLAHGKRITSHWSAIDELRADGRAAEVLDDVRFVMDGNIIHSAGVSAGIDMALWLVGHLADEDFARQVQKLIEYYPAPPYAEAKAA
jgi:transcriptional regulator GlxA family with amidase domain